MTRAGTIACLTLTLALLTSPGAGADTLATAEDLFAEQAYAQATALYHVAAENGSAPAMMRLGLMADIGLGRAKNPETALEWYRRAASQGLPDAMFNVAIMHEAGIGTERSAEEAYLWYSRAALRGHGRAQYNLGLLFDAGIGVPASPALSRFWFDRASRTIPAAAQRLQAPQLPSRTSAEIDPNIMAVSTAQDGFEVIWHAGGIPSDRFLLEIAYPGLNAGFARIETSSESGSAVLLPRAVAQQAVGVRVTQINNDGENYRRSAWRSLQDGWSLPQAQVLLRVPASRPEMDALAESLSQDLAAHRIALEHRHEPTSQTQVRYGFEQDAPLAHAVAGLLPLPDAVPVTLERGAGLQPGQIALDIRTAPPMAAAQGNRIIAE